MTSESGKVDEVDNRLRVKREAGAKRQHVCKAETWWQSLSQRFGQAVHQIETLQNNGVSSPP
jgi:hypothetical protein